MSDPLLRTPSLGTERVTGVLVTLNHFGYRTLARSGMPSARQMPTEDHQALSENRRRRPPSSFETEGYLSVLTDNASDARIETEDLWAPSAFIANTTLPFAMQTTNLE
ncbi:hypothetical protein CKAH01_02121 [Colletotrichum kahawae]|uniref:Uncharacterized protein n=1 Tax=Colletotrichum kahawae TaxID=34407 RepID=A0AAD9Y1X4_COLKA|nr:hypothetical protein CKAH01_02121 [Colletotrichum kahawae]